MPFAFHDRDRAGVVGDMTYGSSGRPFTIDLGDGIRAAVSTKREYFPDGSPFEGIGIAPDLRVVPTPEDRRTGRDPALARALELLRVAPAVSPGAAGRDSSSTRPTRRSPAR